MTPRVAVLIDGGFVLKRMSSLRPDLRGADAAATARAMNQLVGGHLYRLNRTHRAANHWSLLYRAFYYDARPFAGASERPISRTRIDFSKTPEAAFRNELHAELRQTRKFAVRLGEVYKEHGWRLREKASKDVARGVLMPSDLTDDHFEFGFRQKGVDMRIGTDMASITLKGQANTIVLVAGDSDFVTTAKLARREGVEVILDPMGWSVRPALFEHIDGVQTGLPRRRMPEAEETTE